MKKLAIAIALLLAAAAALSAVSPQLRSRARAAWLIVRSRPIADAARLPDESAVLVVGTVRRRLATPFTRRALIEVGDDTGRVLVACEGPAPATGRKVAVEGTVETDPGPLQGVLGGGWLIEAESVHVLP